MKKISEYENEDALELLSDLMEPAAVMFSDKKLVELMKAGAKLPIIQYIIKKFPKEIINVLATLEGVKVKDYHANLIKMTNELLEIMNDQELVDFFGSQVQIAEKNSLISATESIKEKEK